MATCTTNTASKASPMARTSARRPVGLVTLAALASLGIATSTLPAWAVTIEEVVQKAVDSHPEVGALRANRRAVNQELRAARGAYLSLQDHGDPVWYRNIRIRELGHNDSIDQTPVTPAEIPADILEAESQKLEGIIKRREAARQKQRSKKTKS